MFSSPRVSFRSSTSCQLQFVPKGGAKRVFFVLSYKFNPKPSTLYIRACFLIHFHKRFDSIEHKQKPLFFISRVFSLIQNRCTRIKNLFFFRWYSACPSQEPVTVSLRCVAKVTIITCYQINHTVTLCFPTGRSPCTRNLFRGNQLQNHHPSSDNDDNNDNDSLPMVITTNNPASRSNVPLVLNQIEPDVSPSTPVANELDSHQQYDFDDG